ERTVLYRAGLTAGFGRLGVSNAIWDKPGPLSVAEWERVRLAPRLAERMLRQSPPLAPVAALAGKQRERLDGSRYPAGPAAAALAAAATSQPRPESRPHRPARSAGEAAADLRGGARSGRLDPEAVAAVLAAAGHRVVRRQANVAGLTAREIDVLRLAVRG